MAPSVSAQALEDNDTYIVTWRCPVALHVASQLLLNPDQGFDLLFGEALQGFALLLRHFIDGDTGSAQLFDRIFRVHVFWSPFVLSDVLQSSRRQGIRAHGCA